MEYIVRDRYGYWIEISASSPEEAIRQSSNLAKEANLDYATTFFIGEAAEFSDDLQRHNCAVAMDIGGGHKCR